LNPLTVFPEDNFYCTCPTLFTGHRSVASSSCFLYTPVIALSSCKYNKENITCCPHPNWSLELFTWGDATWQQSAAISSRSFVRSFVLPPPDSARMNKYISFYPLIGSLVAPRYDTRDEWFAVGEPKPLQAVFRCPPGKGSPVILAESSISLLLSLRFKKPILFLMTAPYNLRERKGHTPGSTPAHAGTIRGSRSTSESYSHLLQSDASNQGVPASSNSPKVVARCSPAVKAHMSVMQYVSSFQGRKRRSNPVIDMSTCSDLRSAMPSRRVLRSFTRTSWCSSRGWPFKNSCQGAREKSQMILHLVSNLLRCC
jgi:hypothetical protein